MTSDGKSIGSLLVEVLTSRLEAANREETQSQLQRALVSAIFSSGVLESTLAASRLEISEARKERVRACIVQNLRYLHMEDREGRISAAHSKTFRWIFDDDAYTRARWPNLKDWLISDARLYWITGKPGSGKSTLMKYLCRPTMPKTRAESSSSKLESLCTPYLEKWAASARLVTVAFYFWNAGIQDQMTQGGLFRTLLVQIFEQLPELIPLAAPKRREALCLFSIQDRDFSERELRDMLLAAVQHLPIDVRLCLFIDGLDEFAGDHNILINLFRDILGSPSIKLCVASRPWVVFEDAFSHHASLRLQDLTYKDIKAYVLSNLDGDARFHLLQKREPDYAVQLIENIVSKASGVFLWVRLVVTSLLAGMGHGDRISDLQRRLDFLPPELEQLYDKLLESLDPFYFGHAAQIIRMVQESPESMSLLLLSFADEDNREYALTRQVGQISTDEAATRADVMRRRLNACCKGLLEASGSTEAPKTTNSVAANPNWTIQYLHRTVKDFIESPKVHNRLQSALDSSFDPHLQLCGGTLAHLKSVFEADFDMSPGYSFWHRVSLIFYSASRIKPDHRKTMIKLIDDLDATGSTLAGMRFNSEALGGMKFKYNQWVPFHPLSKCPMFGRHFLSLAIRHGITEYVMERSNPGCLVHRAKFIGDPPKDEVFGDYQDARAKKSFVWKHDSGSNIHPLILDAIFDFECPEWDDEKYFRGCVPNNRLITRLLEKGAIFDPFQNVNNDDLAKAWCYLMDKMLTATEEGRQYEDWLAVIDLAAQSGQKMPKMSAVEHYVAQRQTIGFGNLEVRTLLQRVKGKFGPDSSSASGKRKSWLPWL